MNHRYTFIILISLIAISGIKAQKTIAPPWYFSMHSDSMAATGIDSAHILLSNILPEEVTVAVIDAGVDITHLDLRKNIWVNEDEIPNNQIDDDQNGYIDDVHGWNFLGNAEGENLQGAAYEYVRIYDTLRHEFDSARLQEIPYGTDKNADLYREASEFYHNQLQEYHKTLSFYSNIIEGYREAGKVLNKHFDDANYSYDDIVSIDSDRPDIRWAQRYHKKLKDEGLSRGKAEKQVRIIQSVLSTKLNPDYHPRELIGDQVRDITDSIYGNADVNGGTASHGTAVAGIIGASWNNIGIKGIAPRVKIMPIRAVPGGDEWDKDIALAIRYAVDNGADIINGSFGKMTSPDKDMVDQAIRYAERHDVLIVLGAGNDHKNNDIKPNYPNRFYSDNTEAGNVIVVGASTRESGENLAASFSNYGQQQVDIFAPGVDIQGLNEGNRFRKVSGSSAAAPVVAGVAALIKAYYPDVSAVTIKEIIMETAQDYSQQQVIVPGSDTIKFPFSRLCVSGGIINAFKAISEVKKRYREGTL
ncbi:MAG: S8 family serine peptidase [Bacteroidota bacterium]